MVPRGFRVKTECSIEGESIHYDLVMSGEEEEVKDDTTKRTYAVLRSLSDRRMSSVYIGYGVRQIPEGLYVPIDDGVVIKVVKRRHVADAHHEINVMKSVMEKNVPNCIQLLDCFQDRDNVYLIMPYISGEELLSVVLDSEGLDETRTWYVLRSIIDAMLALKNRCGVAHHDISLDNMIINKKNKIVLIDFGLSLRYCDKKKDFVPRMYKYAGKHNYMAPEIVNSNAYYLDAYAADVWSLGVCLYSMLTCRMLYENTKDILFRKVIKCPRYVRNLLYKQRKDVSCGLRKLVCDMLNPFPECRPTLEEIQNILMAPYENTNIFPPPSPESISSNSISSTATNEDLTKIQCTHDKDSDDSVEDTMMRFGVMGIVPMPYNLNQMIDIIARQVRSCQKIVMTSWTNLTKYFLDHDIKDNDGQTETIYYYSCTKNELHATQVAPS